jgi:hypothetical protein
MQMRCMVRFDSGAQEYGIGSKVERARGHGEKDMRSGTHPFNADRTISPQETISRVQRFASALGIIEGFRRKLRVKFYCDPRFEVANDVTRRSSNQDGRADPRQHIGTQSCTDD